MTRIILAALTIVGTVSSGPIMLFASSPGVTISGCVVEERNGQTIISDCVVDGGQITPMRTQEEPKP